MASRVVIPIFVKSPEEIALHQEAVSHVVSRQWRTSDDLEAVACNAYVQKLVKSQYATVDVAGCLDRLVLCKDALQFAKQCAGDQPCSVKVILSISEYQNVVHNSVIASSQFVNTTLEALKIHKVSFTFFSRGKVEMALEQYSKLCRLAQEMEKVAAAVEQEASKLMDVCQEALVGSQNDLCVSAEKKRSMEMECAKLRSLEARHRRAEERVKEHLEEKARYIEQLAEERKDAKNSAWWGSVGKAAVCAVGAALCPAATVVAVGAYAVLEGGSEERDGCVAIQQELAQAKALMDANVEDLARRIKEKEKEIGECEDEEKGKELKDEINKMEDTKGELAKEFADAARMASANAKSIEAKEVAAQQGRMDLQKIQLEISEKLAETVDSLGNMTVRRNNVEHTHKSMNLCVETLAQIKNMFANVRLFWAAVALHCRSLATAAEGGELSGKLQKGIADGDESALEFKDKVQELFVNSAADWAALGVQCLAAFRSMMEAKREIDGLMDNMPVGEAADARIQEMVTKLGISIREDISSGRAAVAASSSGLPALAAASA